jgi:hypothetical protein
MPIHRDWMIQKVIKEDEEEVNEEEPLVDIIEQDIGHS